MNFGEILEKSWKIIWKNKILWLFGLLAGCGARGGGGGGGSNYSGSSGQPNFNNGGQPFQVPPQFQNMYNGIERYFNNISEGAIIGLVMLLIAVLCLIAILSMFASVLGHTGLKRGAWLADEGHAQLNLSTVWQESKPYYWRVFLLHLLFGVGGLFLGFLVAMAAVFLVIFTLGIGVLCLLPLCCLLIPIGWFITVLREEATVAIVGENLGVIDGLKRGWEVTVNNLGNMAIMGLILFVGRTVLGLAMVLPMFLIMAPVIIGLIVGKGALGTGLIIGLALLCLYIPILWLLSAILESYLGTAWTLTFRRLTGRGVEIPPAPTPASPEIPPLPEPGPEASAEASLENS